MSTATTHVIACVLAACVCACERNSQPDAKPAAEAASGEETRSAEVPAEDGTTARGALAEVTPEARGGTLADNGASPESQPAESQPAESQPAKAKPEVKCIKSPKSDAARRLKVSTKEVKESDVDDLDGDGRKDLHVSDASGITGAGDHHIYLSGGGCWAHAGVVVGFGPSRMKSSTKGRRDLSNWEPGGCMGYEGRLEVFKWDGSKYARSKSVYCECPDSDEVKRAPECPAVDE